MSAQPQDASKQSTLTEWTRAQTDAGKDIPIMLDDTSLPRTQMPSRSAHGVASRASGTGADQRQMMRLLLDLKTTIRQRALAQRRLVDARRTTLQRLTLVSARFEHGGLEHCLRVGALAALLGDTLGKPIPWCDMLFDAAPVHDIGNIDIPAAILHKCGRLSSDEWRSIRRHPLSGARLLDTGEDALHYLAAEIALNHHEKWDGSGYPAGRVTTNIPESARIVAVADFVDALLHAAPHRAALPEARIFELLDLAAGAQFDPAVVAAMHHLRPLLSPLQAMAAKHARTAEAQVRWPLWWRELRGTDPTLPRTVKAHPR